VPLIRNSVAQLGLKFGDIRSFFLAMRMTITLPERRC